MAREFDIYLKKRLTECDFIVNSIPYRDGLTAMNRMILESCLENYLLQKFIAAQTGSELMAHIDDMIKTCLERLECGAELGAEADFYARYLAPRLEGVVELGIDAIQSAASVFAGAENNMALTVAPLVVGLGKSVGRGSSAIEVEAEVRELKRSIIGVQNAVSIDAYAIGEEKHSILHLASGVEPTAEITDLCYRLYQICESATRLNAICLGTEIHYSLGTGSSRLVIDAEVDAAETQKFEALDAALHIMSNVVDTLIQFVDPGDAAFSLGMSAVSIVKRHRLLYEMDDHPLSDFDDMTLDEVDFVIL